jgi:hypothetical protein
MVYADLKRGRRFMIDETGRVTFTPEEQAVVDKAIQDRIARVEGKYSDYEDLKGIEEELKAWGYEGTAKDRREAVKTQREASMKQAELEALKDEARQNGSSPELLSEIRALKADIEDLRKPIKAQEEAAEAKKQADFIWNAQVTEFEELFPDVDLPSLNDDEDFMDFWKASAPSQTISKVWERYSKLVGKAKADATAKIKSNVDRSTSSGRSKSDPSGGTYGLSTTQQDLARKGGMTNKEYSEMMKDIT